MANRPDIDSISDRLAKATPGPWRIRGGHPGLPAFVQAPRLVANHPYDIEVLSDDEGDLYPKWQRAADVNFIAHVRQDVEDLLAYIRELEALTRRD